MFLELAEVLDCPVCRDGFGLVAFVAAIERRRVLEGRLGCPICEVELPIRAGAIEASGATRMPTDAARTSPDATGAADAAGAISTASGSGPDGPRSAVAVAPDLAVAVAALLGVEERKGGRFLLGPPLGRLAADVAGHGEDLELIAWLGTTTELDYSVEDLSAGANPVTGIDPARWPIRAGSLHGVALMGGTAPVTEAWRALRPGGRLALFEPSRIEVESARGVGFRELASDATAWVGERG